MLKSRLKALQEAKKEYHEPGALIFPVPGGYLVCLAPAGNGEYATLAEARAALAKAGITRIGEIGCE